MSTEPDDVTQRLGALIAEARQAGSREVTVPIADLGLLLQDHDVALNAGRILAERLLMERGETLEYPPGF